MIIKPSNDFNETLEPLHLKLEATEKVIRRKVKVMERHLTSKIKTLYNDVLYDLKMKFNGMRTAMDRLREIDAKFEALQPPKIEAGRSAEKMSVA